jgi:hypothetical protein
MELQNVPTISKERKQVTWMITHVNGLLVKDAMFNLDGKVKFLFNFRTEDGKTLSYGIKVVVYLVQ